MLKNAINCCDSGHCEASADVVSDSPAILGPEPHGRGHAGVVFGLITSIL